MSGAYFLVNDTRYDNHHGCLTVVRNLHLGMAELGWRCAGSLPVSSSVDRLAKKKEEIAKADLIIVNGEGSIHHDSKNAMRIFDICSELVEQKPVAIINALWQDNNPDKWKPILAQCKAVFTRDRRSQRELQLISPSVGYAPDLTFFRYPKPSARHRAGYACTDSVVNAWSRAAIKSAELDSELDYLTLFTGNLHFQRGSKDWGKAIKYACYPSLSKLGISVPPRYQSIQFADEDTEQFIRHLNQYRAVCVARYHALCFMIQQELPFVAVSSNSHKSEALLEELGLPSEVFLIDKSDIRLLKHKLYTAVEAYPQYISAVRNFKLQAKEQIQEMLNSIIR